MAPIVLKMIEEKENAPASHNEGTIPPIVDPMNIPTQVFGVEDMVAKPAQIVKKQS
jgi:hypothetical protein